MADEKDQTGMSEEEYHFSDNETDYDMGSASESAAGSTEVAPPAKSIAVRLQEHRRMIIGIFVFLLLLGAVYRMLLPSAPSAPEMIESAPAGKKTSAPQPSVNVAANAMQSPATQGARMPVTAPSTPSASPPPSPAPVVETPAPSAPAGGREEVISLANRLSSLEQQNAALINTLQSQYSQKMSDLELQSSQLREEIKTLKAEITGVEQAFHQLTTLVQKEAASGAPQQGAGAVEKHKRPENARQTGYTVQAIIPGRAWLKSDSGDTVTVAEGDTLRGVGRVVRIDPYDGVVSLDTGQKIITLSYGMGADE